MIPSMNRLFWFCDTHMSHCPARTWRQDVIAGSDWRLVDSKERSGGGGGGSVCSSPPFLRLHGNQCNFRGVTEQTAESRMPSCSPEYSGREKYRQHAKKNSFVYVCSSPGCNSGFYKIYLLLCAAGPLCFRALRRSLFVNPPQHNGGSTESPKCMTWWISANKSICSILRHCRHKAQFIRCITKKGLWSKHLLNVLKQQHLELVWLCLPAFGKRAVSLFKTLFFDSELLLHSCS